MRLQRGQRAGHSRQIFKTRGLDLVMIRASAVLRRSCLEASTVGFCSMRRFLNVL